MNKLTYEPIVDIFPFSYTIEDLRSVYIKLRPLFEDKEPTENIIQINAE